MRKHLQKANINLFEKIELPTVSRDMSGPPSNMHELVVHRVGFYFGYFYGIFKEMRHKKYIERNKIRLKIFSNEEYLFKHPKYIRNHIVLKIKDNLFKGTLGPVCDCILETMDRKYQLWLIYG